MKSFVPYWHITGLLLFPLKRWVKPLSYQERGFEFSPFPAKKGCWGVRFPASFNITSVFTHNFHSTPPRLWHPSPRAGRRRGWGSLLWVICQTSYNPWQEGSGLLLGITFSAASCITSLSAQAQIIPDATLPNNSVVNIEGQIQRITGGTATGGNLFHSFQDLNVHTGETAYFDNALTMF